MRCSRRRPRSSQALEGHSCPGHRVRCPGRFDRARGRQGALGAQGQLLHRRHPKGPAAGSQPARLRRLRSRSGDAPRAATATWPRSPASRGAARTTRTRRQHRLPSRPSGNEPGWPRLSCAGAPTGGCWRRCTRGATASTSSPPSSAGIVSTPSTSSSWTTTSPSPARMSVQQAADFAGRSVSSIRTGLARGGNATARDEVLVAAPR